jgi:outer membrane protein TolC
MARNRCRRGAAFLLAVAGGGCSPAAIDRTDRGVYHLIEDRQKAALGATSDPHIGKETGDVRSTESIYSFTPNPTTPQLPESFLPRSERTAPDAAPEPSTTRDVVPGGVVEMTESIFTPQEQVRVTLFGLSETLAYGMHHAREVQDAKEELYLEALDLTLERHLWTPQFVASVQAEFADYGQVRDFDRAMTVISDAAVTQRLPYGGNVSARIVNTLMRDLGAHTTSGESGNFILAADLPLLRGAGRSAYESRYSAERELIYAVRAYERFRRSFLVDVASGYFNLQMLKMAIANTFVSYKSRLAEWEKADFKARVGQSRDVFEASRAQSNLRQAEASLVSAKEQYATALDRFKIRLGMAVDELLDVLDQDADEAARTLDELLPDVETAAAVDVAVKYRLDLLNTADQVDDAKRGVLIAKNRILPDLDASGSVTLDTDPDRLNSMSYNTERATWRGLLAMRMDDRKTERNAYRESLVVLRKSERDYERATDNVRADVRAAIRQIAQQEKVRTIQMFSVEENQLRLEAAKAQYDLGKRDNRDVVEAEDDLLRARNDMARAVAAYRIAILEFRRDTETLRVDDDGHWAPPPTGP